MTTFARRSCIAFNWTPQGECWGVHLRRAGDRCQVVASWHAQAGRETTVAELLPDGFRQLGGREGVYTVAGGTGLSCGMVDLEMPKLRPEELRNALGFELKKHAPLAVDKLVWGYRVLGSSPEGKQRLRLYFLRRNTWEKWVDEVSGMGQVDMLLPAPVALDPLLAEQPVYFGSVGDSGFVHLPLSDGRREIVPGPLQQVGVFGCGETPLACAALDAGQLSGLPAAEQAAFAPALVLGMYGLTRELSADAATTIALPHHLRPQRHRTSRLLAVGLMVYVAVMGGVGLLRGLQDRRAQLAEIRAERRQVEAEIAEISRRLDDDATKYMAALEQDMTDAYTERPTLAMALLELTRTVGPSAWCQSFEWRDGSIILQLQESEEDLELVRALEFSPVLGDVVQVSKAVAPGGDTVRRFQVNARYDMANEQRAAVERQRDERVSGAEDVPDAAASGGAEVTPGAAPDKDEVPPEDPAGEAAGGVEPPPPPPPPPGGGSQG